MTWCGGRKRWRSAATANAPTTSRPAPRVNGRGVARLGTLSAGIGAPGGSVRAGCARRPSTCKRFTRGRIRGSGRRCCPPTRQSWLACGGNTAYLRGRAGFPDGRGLADRWTWRSRVFRPGWWSRWGWRGPLSARRRRCRRRGPRRRPVGRPWRAPGRGLRSAPRGAAPWRCRWRVRLR